MKTLFVLLLGLLAAVPSYAQTAPASPLFETRAAWVATVYGLDWPPLASPAAQQQLLRDHFRRLKGLGLNTIIFQVVSHGEALYPSERLPWSRWIAGTQGRDPGWDPLGFAVEEAHRLGMELHAWYNVSHVGNESNPPHPQAVPQHVVLAHPEWIKEAQNSYWLNPGLPDARAWVVDNVVELIEQYDVDGIHFDYMRYPTGGFFDDGNTRRNHPNDAETLADWRRENLTLLARDVYAAVEARKPWVKVGAAPIGAYKNFSGAPPGFWAYDDVFQDSRRWMEVGALDYAAPQLYFDIGNAPDPGVTYPSQDFTFWLRDWLGAAHGRHVYAGHGTWREVYAPERAFDAGEVARQIDVARQEGAEGQVHFRSTFLSAGVLGGRYDRPALPAPMPWKFVAAAPTPPAGATIELDPSTSTVTVRWHAATGAEADPLRRYAVFRRQGGEPALDSVEDLVALVGPQDTSFAEVFSGAPDEPVYYRVAAQSQLGFLSEASAVVHTGMTPLPAAGGADLPGRLRLTALYPNPARAAVNVAYEVAEPAPVVLTVFDLLGRAVVEIDRGFQAPGTYDLTISTGAMAAGVYTVALQSGPHRDVRRLVLTR